MCARAEQRVAFGKPLAEQGVVRDWIAESCVRLEQLWPSTYSRMAWRATSCIGRPSWSARWRSALASESVSRKVIAMPGMVSRLIPVADRTHLATFRALPGGSSRQPRQCPAPACQPARAVTASSASGPGRFRQSRHSLPCTAAGNQLAANAAPRRHARLRIARPWTRSSVTLAPGGRRGRRGRAGRAGPGPAEPAARAQAHAEVVAFARQLLDADPSLRSAQLADAIEQRFGIRGAPALG